MTLWVRKRKGPSRPPCRVHRSGHRGVRRIERPRSALPLHFSHFLAFVARFSGQRTNFLILTVTSTHFTVGEIGYESSYVWLESDGCHGLAPRCLIRTPHVKAKGDASSWVECLPLVLDEGAVASTGHVEARRDGVAVDTPPLVDRCVELAADVGEPAAKVLRRPPIVPLARRPLEAHLCMRRISEPSGWRREI